MTSRETKDWFHRPKNRRLINLSNEELAELFKIRAKKISTGLKTHTMWDNNQIIYWSLYMKLQADLYEVMLEIQARYPANEVAHWQQLLPVWEEKT